LLIDAVRLDVAIPQLPLIHGDAVCFSIAAASILAKVARDAALDAWDRVFPEYGFARHKGYGTPDHLEALRRFGPTPLHRFSFEPVRDAGPSPAGTTMTPPASGVMRWFGYPRQQMANSVPSRSATSQQAELFACL
jgi:ribonuclease HII